MLKAKKQNKKKKGFTLIELIVVLAVLAIIALIAIPNFNQIRENSKVSSDQRGADLIDKSITLLVQDGTINSRTADGSTPGAVIASKTCELEFSATNNGLAVKTPGGLTVNEVKAINAVLVDTKAAQQNGKPNYTLKISGLDGANPKVEVSIKGYTSSV